MSGHRPDYILAAPTTGKSYLCARNPMFVDFDDLRTRAHPQFWKLKLALPGGIFGPNPQPWENIALAEAVDIARARSRILVSNTVLTNTDLLGFGVVRAPQDLVDIYASRASTKGTPGVTLGQATEWVEEYQRLMWQGRLTTVKVLEKGRFLDSVIPMFLTLSGRASK